MKTFLVACVGALVVAAGCGATTPVPEGFTSLCPSLALTKGLRPTQPVDGIEHRSEVADAGGWSVASDDKQGSLCSAATDKAACEKKVAATRVLTTCNGVALKEAAFAPEQQRCQASYYVYTRGDEVGTLRSLPDTLAFLGEIDSPEEAVLVAQMNGEAFSCGEREASFRVVGGGFEVSASAVCGARILRVSNKGVVTLVEDC